MAVKIFNVARSDKNEILTNVFRSKGVLVGTSTMNNVMMPKIAGLVEEMTGLRFRNKRASAFGLTAGVAVRWIVFPRACRMRVSKCRLA
ncbi:hypothetical protein MUTS16_63950 [Escherichia coli]|nr:hypothetical protein MUTS16_63950 [Escherichia coli]